MLSTLALPSLTEYVKFPEIPRLSRISLGKDLDSMIEILSRDLKREGEALVRPYVNTLTALLSPAADFKITEIQYPPTGEIAFTTSSGSIVGAHSSNDTADDGGEEILPWTVSSSITTNDEKSISDKEKSNANISLDNNSTCCVVYKPETAMSKISETLQEMRYKLFCATFGRNGGYFESLYNPRPFDLVCYAMELIIPTKFGNFTPATQWCASCINQAITLNKCFNPGNTKYDKYMIESVSEFPICPKCAFSKLHSHELRRFVSFELDFDDF